MRFQFLILFGLNFFSVFSQEQQINFQQITAEQGLTQGHILCMLQDKEGYIWIGTYHGLNRYNGYDIKEYTNDPNNKNSLTNNVVYSLLEDKDGFIWVGTSWGLDKFDKKTETFTHIPVIWAENALNSGAIKAIVQDDKGNLWIGTQDGGVDKLDYTTKKLSYFVPDTLHPNGLECANIKDLIIDHSNNLWIATMDGGLSMMDLATEKMTLFMNDPKNPSSIPSDKITCLFEDDEHLIWFGIEEGKLGKYDPKSKKFSKISFLPADFGFPNIKILDINQDVSGNILLATNGAGLVIYNKQSGKLTVSLHSRSEDRSIASNETSSILRDRTNTIFVGTYGRGISKYSPFNHKFEVHYVPVPAKSGQDINAFTDCVEDSRGHMIIATYNGFLVYNKSDWTYKHILPGNTYEDNKILTIAIAPDSTFWFSSFRGLHRYDRNFNKIRSYTLLDDDIDHPIYSLLFDNNKNLWLGLFTVGLVKIEPSEWMDQKKKSLHYSLYSINYNDSTTISGNQNWTIRQDKQNNIWVGNEGGLSRFNPGKNNFTRYNITGNVKAIEFDSKGKMWIATSGKGLYYLDTATNLTKHYTTANGLSHNFIFGIVIDRNNELWMDTEWELSRFNPVTEKFRNYDIYDGLPDNHFDDKSESPLKNGKIYMGTPKGFIIFDPAKIVDDTSYARVVLTNFRISNIPVNKLTEYKNKIPVDLIRSFDLSASQKDFSIEFAALHYAAPHKIKYAYQLEGFDNDWIETTAKNRVARYTNLNGGKYIFRVKATNSDGVWNSKPLELTIFVHPPFYRTIQFYILVVSLFLLSVLLIVRWRIVREVAQRVKLAKLVEERTTEISEKNKQLEQTAFQLNESNTLLEERQQNIEEQKEELAAQRDELVQLNATKDKLFSIIAHDLKNPFNAIMGFSDLLLLNYKKYDDERKQNIIETISQSSQSAFELLENLLLWSRSQSNALVFNPKNITTGQIIDSTMSLVENLAKEKEISIEFGSYRDDITIKADINMLNTILRNLISNALKFSFKKGRVKINVIETADMVQFSVTDYGTGMTRETIDSLFKMDKTQSLAGTAGEKGTGLGLLICKDFVDFHKGEIWAESELGNGATFYFTIPKK